MKFKFLLLLSIVALSVVPARAQTNTFCASNLGCTVAGQWLFSKPVVLTPTTVSGLPAASGVKGGVAAITDGASSGDCTVGGGANVVFCGSNGSTWISIASSAGAVTSVFSRSGAVVAATNDYTCTQVTNCTQKICSGTISLSTSAIGSGARATNTLSCTGASASTDTISCAYTSDVNGVTGYASSASGSLFLRVYVTTNTINVDQINNTGSSITPGAASVNCKALR